MSLPSSASAARSLSAWTLLALLAVAATLPVVMDSYAPTVLLIWAVFAMSLGLQWGYGGILSFGHAAFFGLGAYGYAVAAINLGDAVQSFAIALLLCAVVAALLGAMMFFARIKDVYVGVITLVFSLLLTKFMGATGGEAYRIGEARLGGFNGIPSFPLFHLPGRPDDVVSGDALYYLCVAVLAACYLIARWLLASTPGKVLVGTRESDLRCELLGYNVPMYQTGVFVVSATMAGVAGCLFATWAENVTPALFGLGLSVDAIIWVMVGGLGTLAGPIAGAFLVGALKLSLGEQTTVNNSLILGVILTSVVLFFPRGVFVSVIERVRAALFSGERG